MSPIRRIALVCAVVAAGCSGGNKGPADAGVDAGRPYVDAGPVDAGPTACATDVQCTAPQVCDSVELYCVTPCVYDDGCGVGRICTTTTGHCSPATACNTSSGSDPCVSTDSTNYCFEKGDQCVCEPDTRADAGSSAGFCERVRPTCAPCTDAGQCSTCPDNASSCDITNFVYPSACASVGGGLYCLRTLIAGASCPNGYTPDSATGTCQPPGGMCAGAAGCTTNDECLALSGTGSICDISSGDCELGCTFDYTEGQSADCPVGDVCDPIPSYLLPDAGLLNYGYGHCVPPCNATGGENCAALGATVGLDFECVTEKSGEHRCRPVDRDAGVTCMSDLECPPSSDGGPYAGYCEVYAFACEYNCRDGIDPLNGTSYSAHDCAPPGGSSSDYQCIDNQCVERNCVQLGGAAVGLPDQLCCGEDRDHTGSDDAGFADTTHPANACPAGVDAGQFFTAPAPPWCLPTCSTSAVSFTDGGAISAFDEQFASCSVDAGLPSLDSSPNVCIEYAPGAFACSLAAAFDTECPLDWSRSGTVATCSTDADCDDAYPDGGVSDGGNCFTQTYPDGGVVSQFCACDAHQPERLDAGSGALGPYLWGGVECPQSTRCYASAQGTPGPQCVYTVACAPNVEVCTIGLAQ